MESGFLQQEAVASGLNFLDAKVTFGVGVRGVVAALLLVLGDEMQQDFLERLTAGLFHDGAGEGGGVWRRTGDSRLEPRPEDQHAGGEDEAALHDSDPGEGEHGRYAALPG